MPYIASTMAAPVEYVDYATGGSGSSNRIKRKVRINGGAGVASREHALANGVLTPEGVVTKVTEDELEFLQKDEVFQAHLKHGHVKVMRSDTKPAKAAADMNKDDPSAPLTDKDFKEGGRASGNAPKTSRVR